jgi:membrane associated rhomboid family serine protease
VSENEANLEPESYVRISAQTRRQAMDWSLVLASQDIHPIIAPPEETGAWGLLVEPGQYERALAAIRQYRLENRGWAWRRELPGAALEVHVGALFWCLILAFWHWVVTFVWPELEVAGRMDSARVRAGEWWRLGTAVMLHADLAHLMANATFGVIFLGFAMARYGAGVTLLTTYLAGLIGNVAGLKFYSHPYIGVGASGMMMGALGLLCVHSLGLWRENPKAARYVVSGVFAGFFLFILFGVNPRADILAHLGGFVAGLVFGAVLSFVPQRKLESRPLNIVAFSILLVAVIGTWTVALRR